MNPSSEYTIFADKKDLFLTLGVTAIAHRIGERLDELVLFVFYMTLVNDFLKKVSSVDH